MDAPMDQDSPGNNLHSTAANSNMTVSDWASMEWETYMCIRQQAAAGLLSAEYISGVSARQVVRPTTKQTVVNCPTVASSPSKTPQQPSNQQKQHHTSHKHHTGNNQHKETHNRRVHARTQSPSASSVLMPQTSKEGSTATALKPAQAKALDGPCECFSEKSPIWNLHHQHHPQPSHCPRLHLHKE